MCIHIYIYRYIYTFANLHRDKRTDRQRQGCFCWSVLCLILNIPICLAEKRLLSKCLTHPDAFIFRDDLLVAFGWQEKSQQVRFMLFCARPSSYAFCPFRFAKAQKILSLLCSLGLCGGQGETACIRSALLSCTFGVAR